MWSRKRRASWEEGDKHIMTLTSMKISESTVAWRLVQCALPAPVSHDTKNLALWPLLLFNMATQPTRCHASSTASVYKMQIIKWDRIMIMFIPDFQGENCILRWNDDMFSKYSAVAVLCFQASWCWASHASLLWHIISFPALSISDGPHCHDSASGEGKTCEPLLIRDKSGLADIRKPTTCCMRLETNKDI